MTTTTKATTPAVVSHFTKVFSEGAPTDGLTVTAATPQVIKELVPHATVFADSFGDTTHYGALVQLGPDSQMASVFNDKGELWMVGEALPGKVQWKEIMSPNAALAAAARELVLKRPEAFGPTQAAELPSSAVESFKRELAELKAVAEPQYLSAQVTDPATGAPTTVFAASFKAESGDKGAILLDAEGMLLDHGLASFGNPPHWMREGAQELTVAVAKGQLHF